MDKILDLWPLLVALVAVIVMAVTVIACFFKKPSAQQIENIKEWLKYAVTEAEKALGGGTGQLKLRMVYDLATAKAPWILRIITFDTFTAWVDEALIWMNHQLATNERLESYVESI